MGGNVLSRKSVLVSLKVSQWTAEQVDRSVSDEIATDKKATRSAGRYRKKLLPGCQSLTEIHKLSKAMGKTFVANTLPWGDKGTRVLPTAHYMAYIDRFREDRKAWLASVDDFIKSYVSDVMDARTTLGDLFDPNDYPAQSDLSGRFSMEISTLPYPDVEDFRIAMPELEMQRIRDSMEEENRKTMERVNRDLWDRLHNVVSRMTERLSDPKNVFHGTLVTNVQDLCGLLEGLNVTKDADLEAMRRDVMASLGRRDVHALRNDAKERSSAHVEAERIMRNMAALRPAA